ncbi:MAG TPA: RNA polymerase sigma factor [Acidothermaceae bacterium]|nr:RNA polymerase sigma factor [Acidothermaceae bacterium]
MTSQAMADIPFEQTLAAARSGDEQAFGTLWRALHPPLLRYLRVLAPKIADDVASEVWLQVIRGLRGFSGDEAGFKSWLFTIARNKVTDSARQAARRPLEISDDDISPAVAPDDTAAQALERFDTEAALALIATLPPDQAEIIMLRVVAGLEVADVARVVRKSPGAVRVTSHRALRKLRELLAQSGDSAAAEPKAVTR